MIPTHPQQILSGLLALKAHRQICQDFLQEIGATEFQSNTIPPYRVWGRKYDFNKESLRGRVPPNYLRTLMVPVLKTGQEVVW